jgi:phage terminase small subunit
LAVGFPIAIAGVGLRCDILAMAALKNAKHESFARAILEGMSGRDAYLSAGYSAQPAAADAAASRLLKNVKVSARVAELKAAAARASTVTAARVLDELAKLAFANMLDYMKAGPDGDPYLDFSKLNPRPGGRAG